MSWPAPRSVSSPGLSPAKPPIRKGASRRLDVRLAELERLRVHVDHGLEAGAAHRGRCGGEQAGGGRGDAPGLLGLRDQLGAVPAAEAEQGRRADRLGVSEPGADLLEQPSRIVGGAARHEDANDMAERRVAELLAAAKLL